MVFLDYDTITYSMDTNGVDTLLTTLTYKAFVAVEVVSGTTGDFTTAGYTYLTRNEDATNNEFYIHRQVVSGGSDFAMGGCAVGQPGNEIRYNYERISGGDTTLRIHIFRLPEGV